MFLILRKYFAGLNSYYLKRYYEQKHDGIQGLVVGEKKTSCNFSKSGIRLNAQQNVFRRPTVEATVVVNVTMRISHIIGKKMAPFMENESTEECLLQLAQETSPRKVKNFSQISLLRQTDRKRTTDDVDISQLPIYSSRDEFTHMPNRPWPRAPRFWGPRATRSYNDSSLT